MKEFRVFQQIQDSPGKIDKLNLLKQNDSESLRKLLYLTYNRFLTYRIKKIDLPGKFNSVQPDITCELDKLLTLLSQHDTGANESKRLIQNLLARSTEEGSNWICKIITRDLKIGIDENTILKAFPGLFPTWEIQLAFPVYSGGKNPTNRWPTLKYPIIGEEKLDGVRCCAVCDGSKVTFYSREGHEFSNCEVFEAEILKLRPGTSFVCDGEIIGTKFNPDIGISIKNKDHGWPYEQGKSMLKNSATTKAEMKEFTGYFIWDVVETPYFLSQGKEGKDLSLVDRKLQLCSMFERQEIAFNNLVLVPNIMCNSEEEVKALFRQIRDQGGQKSTAVTTKDVEVKIEVGGKAKKYIVPKGTEISYTRPAGEGIMIKSLDKSYDFRRSDAVLKVKEFPTADLRIIGAYEGKPGTKYEGMLGGINLADDTGVYSTDCGSGFDADARYELWMRHKRGELVGAIWQISYQEITADGSLRFPVAQFERTDKTTTNVE